MIRGFLERIILWHSRRPLPGTAVFFVFGIFCGFDKSALVFTLVALTFCLFLSRIGKIAAPLFAVFICGFILGEIRLAKIERDAVRLMSLPEETSIVCEVGEILSCKTTKKGLNVSFRCTEVLPENSASVLEAPLLLVRWRGSEKDAPQSGERWRFSGHLRGNLVWPFRRLPGATFTTSGGERIRTNSSPLLRLREIASVRLSCGMERDPLARDLMRAIFLGSRQEIPKDVREIFAASGTVHIFAISGLHIVLVATVLVIAASFLRIPSRIRPWFILPALACYVLLTGARPSAVRACIMSALYILSPMLKRKPDALNALSATALVVYARNPALVFDLGCTLSFAVMSGLVVFFSPMRILLRKFLGLGKLSLAMDIANACGAKSRLRRLAGVAWFLRYLADALAVSIAAFLTSLPLTAGMFGRITLGSVIANLVIGPCSFFAVVSSMLSLTLGVLGDWCASCFNLAGAFFIRIMLACAEWTAKLPGASLTVEQWATWKTVGWFALLSVFAATLHCFVRNTQVDET